MSDHEHWWMGPAPELRWRDLLYLLLACVALVGFQLGIMRLMGGL